jgi:hypothetical protein
MTSSRETFTFTYRRAEIYWEHTQQISALLEKIFKFLFNVTLFTYVNTSYIFCILEFKGLESASRSDVESNRSFLNAVTWVRQALAAGQFVL